RPPWRSYAGLARTSPDQIARVSMNGLGESRNGKRLVWRDSCSSSIKMTSMNHQHSRLTLSNGSTKRSARHCQFPRLLRPKDFSIDLDSLGRLRGPDKTSKNPQKQGICRDDRSATVFPGLSRLPELLRTHRWEHRQRVISGSCRPGR